MIVCSADRDRDDVAGSDEGRQGVTSGLGADAGSSTLADGTGVRPRAIEHRTAEHRAAEHRAAPGAAPQLPVSPPGVATMRA